MSNMKLIYNARTSMCVVGGMAAGILGCKGLEGLLAYLVIYLMSSILLAVKMGFDPSKFINLRKGRAFTFFFSDVQGHALTFILFWTLAYALVYIY
ncbi:unnamed protein product [Phaeothamnion confervicola]